MKRRIHASCRTAATSGFTLIELLIVVAIIAILAAIAVPNFLEAQVRAKVSRAKADMRSLAVAVESYRVDNNRYPTPSNDLGQQVVPTSGGTEWFETRMSHLVTTPIAYITTVLSEPFPSQTDPENKQFHYGTRDYAVFMTGADTEWTDYFTALKPTTPTASIGYFMMSHGPDAAHQSPDLGENPAGPSLYDPTNGTVSKGDVIYAGPGTGLLN